MWLSNHRQGNNRSCPPSPNPGRSSASAVARLLRKSNIYHAIIMCCAYCSRYGSLRLDLIPTCMLIGFPGQPGPNFGSSASWVGVNLHNSASSPKAEVELGWDGGHAIRLAGRTTNTGCLRDQEPGGRLGRRIRRAEIGMEREGGGGMTAWYAHCMREESGGRPIGLCTVVDVLWLTASRIACLLWY